MTRSVISEHGRFSTTLRRVDAGDFRLGLYRIGRVADLEKTHLHPRTSLSLLLDGTVVTRHAGGDEFLQAGAIEVEPACVPHAHHMRSDGMYWCTVEVDSKRLQSISELSGLLSRPRQIRDAGCIEVFRRIVRELVHTPQPLPLMLESLSLELLSALVRTSEQSSLGDAPPWVRHVVNRMERQCAGRVRLVDLAHEVGLHPVHFAREFRRHMRIPPGEYVRRQRIQRAIPLLTDSNLPLAIIAQTCGFADQSHFTRLFVRHTGITPRRFRARWASR
jgi:AraC family transcriptional regulator